MSNFDDITAPDHSWSSTMEGDLQELHHRPSGLRRAFTMRNNVARQVAVNFMPSRQTYSTLRRAQSESDALLEEAVETEVVSVEHQVNIIVRSMEQHEQLMEDNPEAEEMRKEALRELPQGLTMKRTVRAKLSASVSHKSHRTPISLWKRIKYRISFAWKRGRDRLRNFIFSIELWYEAIRNIEGYFGSAVGTYFHFLRWLFTCNVLMLAALVCFVVAPQVLHDRYVSVPVREMGFLNFISGRGWLEDSLLFYGHYHSGEVAALGPSYSITFAYFFTMLCIYVTCFAFLCYRTAYSYRSTFIETGGGVRHAFANKLFSGWDFGIAAEQSAQLHHTSIYNELKELLAEQNRKKVQMPLWTKIGQYVYNIGVTALVLGSIAGLGYGFWQLLGMESVTSRYWEVVVSANITVVVSLCPVLFNLIVKLEYYSPRTALYVTLARTCLLDFGTIFLVLYFWASSEQPCWETSLGQESYRLVLLDAYFSLILLPMFEFIRSFIYKMFPKTSPPEFNIAYNSLTLIYNQAVLWCGMLFSPLLVVAVTIKFLLLFYVKRAVAMYACSPARKVWRAAQTQTVMYMLVTLSLFITLFGIGSLFLKSESQHCGPFKQYKFAFEVLTQGLLNLSQNRRLSAALTFCTRPGVIGFLMVFLGIGVYYMHAKSVAQRSMVEILRQMLVIEAKDKDFLLNAISKVSNGEWLYSPRINDGQPDTHTWKYLHDDRIRKPSNSGYAFDGSRLNHSHATDNRPNSYYRNDSKPHDDGDTDSSFSWQGSSRHLSDPRGEAGGAEGGRREWL